MIRLTSEEIKQVTKQTFKKATGEILPDANISIELAIPLLQAQLKKVADAIESMTADGWWLEGIVKALLKEIEDAD